MTEALAGPASGRRRLTAGLVVLAWCAAVAVAATAAWVVVDRAGISLLGGSGPGLTGGVPGATSTATSAASPTSGRSASFATVGGRVTATCTPTGLVTLDGAIPATGWRVEPEGSGTTRLKVEFRLGSKKIEVVGVCRGGAAVLTLDKGAGSASTTRPAPAVSTTDDHGGNRPGNGGSSSSSGSGGGDDGGGSHGGGSGGGSGGSGSGKSGSGSGSGSG